MLRSAIDQEPTEPRLFRVRFSSLHVEEWRVLCATEATPYGMVEVLTHLLEAAAAESPAAAAAANRWIAAHARPAPAPPAEEV